MGCDPLPFKGERFTVVSVQLPDGTYPLAKYLASLDETERASVAALMKLFADLGLLRGAARSKKLKAPYSDLVQLQNDRKGIRLLGFFQPGGIFVITHGFKKTEDRRATEEYDRAHRLKAGHLDRQGENGSRKKGRHHNA